MTLRTPSPDRTLPLLHRLIAAGHLRYWLILSWALPLWVVTSWTVALIWFLVTTAFGLIRMGVETRLQLADPGHHDRLKLFVATVSCIAWAAAPVIAALHGGAYGVTVAVALLFAGYVLVFTQMRAAPHEALLVSLPYTAVVAYLVTALWSTPAFLLGLSIVPVIGLALVIKVAVTQMKDAELEAINAAQAVLITDLAAARDRADAANAAKSNFLGVVSHELRTPMNGVLGAAQILQMSGLNDKQTEMVGIIRNSGDGLMRLLNDILDMTKIEADQMELRLQTVPTPDLIQQMIGPFSAQAEARGLAFVLDTAGDLPSHLVVDPLRLCQITQNLLGNAIKFTEQGTVGLSITASDDRDGRSRLKVSVSDSGIGIKPDDLERMFQPFAQVDDSSTRRFGGTGLGLSICHRLARLMGGDITVRSVPGEGSVFTFDACFDRDATRSDAALAA
jgi:two-component system, sensor histidine kinase